MGRASRRRAERRLNGKQETRNMVNLPPGVMLQVVQDGPQGARLVSNLPVITALQLLGSLSEQLRVQAAVEAIKADQRVQLATPDLLRPRLP